MNLNVESYVPPQLAIEAMRDNGYRNAASAIAELIDNSIQAGATRVELLCQEEVDYEMQRPRPRIKTIAILDNGCGMDSITLKKALQFGNGTRLEDRTGIGRFGMGLPASSISQARTVEVWSWQDGIFLKTYLDLNNLGTGIVPEPENSEFPKEWQKIAGRLERSGTLVVWRNLDRCAWRTAEAIINNSELLIGRMYRKFINLGKVSIRLCAFTKGNEANPTIDKLAIANDPMYLMSPTSTPVPYDKTPMFEPYGENWEVPYDVIYKGEKDRVVVRYSLAKTEARQRDGGQAGLTAYGQHAKHNRGVSLIRADRELILEQTLVNGYDPRERWWGVEVEFPPSLDELFGVSNTKQDARNFSSVAQFVDREEWGGSWAEFLDTLIQEGDPLAPLYEITYDIKRQLVAIRTSLKASAVKRAGGLGRHKDPEKTATEATAVRKEKNQVGESDAGEALDKETRQGALERAFEEAGLDKQSAAEEANRVLEKGYKYVFQPADLEGNIFFTVRPVAGEIFIKINTNHEAYENLIEVLGEPILEETPPKELVDRLLMARDGLKLLLMSWARYEDEAKSPEPKKQIQDMRADWGRIASEFLKNA